MQNFWAEYLLQQQQSQHSVDPTLSICDTHLGYQAIEEGNSLIPISQFAFISVVGSEAGQFLQGQFTCQIPTTPDHNLLLGAHCSVKGKIQNFFRIIYTDKFGDPGYLLICHHSTLDETLKRLKKYALFSKVEIIDKTDILTAFSVYGDQASDYISDQFEVKSLELNESIFQDNQKALIVRLRGEKKRYLVVAQQQDMTRLWEKKSPGFQKNNSCFWDLIEIRAGIPTIYESTTDHFFVHYLNLPTLNAVSFEKGCYLGQEVIARMQYRGKVKKHLHRALLTDITEKPQPGDEIYSSLSESKQSIGNIVSVAQTTPGNFEALIVLNDEHKNFEGLSLGESKAKLQHLNLTYST